MGRSETEKPGAQQVHVPLSWTSDEIWAEPGIILERSLLEAKWLLWASTKQVSFRGMIRTMGYHKCKGICGRERSRAAWENIMGF